MGTARNPQPVKLFVSMFSSSLSLLETTEARLSEMFGTMDYRSDLLAFDFTSYYESEFGTDLKRRIVAFEKLVDPGELAAIKTATNDLETVLAQHGKRRINLDPGYVSSAKMILATTKDYSHRIYLGMGIYAEITLSYKKGNFIPLSWTYPDYRSPKYLSILTEIRGTYMEQIKQEDSYDS